MHKNFKLLLGTLPIILVFSYALVVSDYSFWRHDAWGYTYSEINEFKYNGRWLAPIFHYFLHNLPHYVAWLLSVIVFLYYGYTFANKHLPSEELENKAFSLFISSSVLLTPSLFSQLNWPIHSLSAFIVLGITAYLSLKSPKPKLVALSTIILFGINQAFAFLTLILLIPKPSKISTKTPKENLISSVFSIVIWAGSMLAAQILSKTLQYIYFGKLPPPT